MLKWLKTLQEVPNLEVVLQTATEHTRFCLKIKTKII